MLAILITPLIDVIMCLLIVFMAIRPRQRRGVELKVPPPDSASASSPDAPIDNIVLFVRSDATYSINDIVVDSARLGVRLRAICAPGRRKVLLVNCDCRAMQRLAMRALVGLCGRQVVIPAPVESALAAASTLRYRRFGAQIFPRSRILDGLSGTG